MFIMKNSLRYFLSLFFLAVLFLDSPGFCMVQTKADLVVAKDGTGQFTSLQKAIDSCKAFPEKRIVILVKPGLYREKIVIEEFNQKLTIIGEDRDKTIIQWDDYFGKMERGRNSTFYTYTLRVEATDCVLENLTIENSAGPVGQAVALHLMGDRCTIKNCRLLGNQDTVYASGDSARCYFTDCYLEGTTDFVFGGATAFFENCEIHCKANSYITAASTKEGQPFGLIFRNCKITADPGIDKVFLGRPWRPFAHTAFIECEMGSFILPQGWNNWGKVENEKCARYEECNNHGAGSSLSQRVTWSRNLPPSELPKYTKDNVLKTKPSKELNKDDDWFNSAY